MGKRRLNFIVCAVSIIAFHCFFAPNLIGSNQENPVINTLYIPLSIGGSPVTTSGVVLIMGQTSTAEPATPTEEKRVKPQSEAPIKIMPSVRISEKD